MTSLLLEFSSVQSEGSMQRLAAYRLDSSREDVFSGDMVTERREIV